MTKEQEQKIKEICDELAKTNNVNDKAAVGIIHMAMAAYHTGLGNELLGIFLSVSKPIFDQIREEVKERQSNDNIMLN